MQRNISWLSLCLAGGLTVLGCGSDGDRDDATDAAADAAANTPDAASGTDGSTAKLDAAADTATVQDTGAAGDTKQDAGTTTDTITTNDATVSVDLGPVTDGAVSAAMTFFVTSRTGGGNLAGLTGADAICKTLATAVGQGSKNWVAYLSTTTPAVNAKDRIGEGPWYNAAGVKIADTSAELHMANPPKWPQDDTSIALTEKGERVQGRRDSSDAKPNEHDVITGTNPDGTAHAANCSNWTSDATTVKAWVGHLDRRAQNVGERIEWNGTHESGGCAPGRATTGIGSGGGSGRFYCFVKN